MCIARAPTRSGQFSLMGLANSRNLNIKNLLKYNIINLLIDVGHVNGKQKIIYTNRDESERPISPPDKFKFSKMQRLKLTVIQANLAPVSELLNGSDSSDCRENGEVSIKPNSGLGGRTLSKASSFDITDPQESFMATISTLITALTSLSAIDSSNLVELVKLFTIVFIKNINIRGLIDVFEFEVEEGKCVTELLLISYINSIVTLSSKSNNSSGQLLEEILKSLLVLISSNVYFKDGHQGRYFHEYLGKLSNDQLKEFFDSLLSITCTFTFKTSNLNFLTSAATRPDKSRHSAQLLAAFSILPVSNELLKNFNDLKSFSLFIKFQSQFFQLTTNFSIGESTILTIFSNFMTNFCSNYRRFLLSKLDNEELVIQFKKVII